MRVYFLRFGYNSLDENTINISQDGDLWVTPALDLYDNNSYKNFSETKSNYGLGGADAYRWIGLHNEAGDFLTPDQLTGITDLTTDSGYRTGGRFIDTTGRIDIVSMKVVSVQLPSVYLYNSDLESDTYYSDEWERRGPFTESDEFDIIGSQRNLKVAFDFGDETPDEDFEAFIRVEIDRPVMAPLYRFTRQMANKFPEWMALHSLPEELDEPELATPNSIGMKFINAVASEWLDDLNRELNYRDFQKYIATVDLTQIAWDWEVNNLPEHVVSVTGDDIELARAHDYSEYLKMRDEDVCYIDPQNDTIYILQEYDSVEVNGVEKTIYSHQVWNYVDEIGMIVDLERLHREGNENYTKRIRDVFKNRGGVGVESLKLALRRELDLWKYEGATPDSDYEGATPEILDIKDIEQDPKYFSPDGLPTQDFVELVESLSKEFPTTWGRFIWNKAIWDIAGEDYAGYGVIPHRYDGELPPDPYLKSGVGDGEDLFVFRPDVFTGPRDFNARLKMRGRHRTTRNEYRPINAELMVRGYGDRDFYEHPAKTVWFTVELEVGGATPGTFIHSFKLSSQSDVDNGVPEPTEESFGRYEIFSEFNDTTHEGIEFVDAVNNDPYNGTGVVPIEDIQSVTLVQGEWIPNTEYGNLETQDHFEAWFSHDPNSIIENETVDGTGITYGWTADATPTLPDSEVVMKSLLTNPPTAGTWYSDAFNFDVEINNLEPYTSEQPAVIDIPEIQWDPYVTNRALEVQFVSGNPFNAVDEEYGGTTVDQDGIQYFIDHSEITVSTDEATPQDLTFTDAVADAPEDTSSFVLSVDSATADNGVDSTAYPIPTDIWTLFEAEHNNSFAGVVDENGPWRYGVAPLPGNTNYILDVFDSLTRDDFDIPNDEDYVVTWVGVDSDNSRTIIWLDSNSVKPVNHQDELEFPPNAIEESIEGGIYVYDPVVVRARIKPEPDPEWYPQIHSGYLYDRADEYYMYAKKAVETVAGDDELILSEVARQGAPVIVHTDGATPRELRQVAFFDDSAATPTTQLSLVNTEEIKGNGTTRLYLAYQDVRDVSVVDADGDSVAVDSWDVVPGTVDFVEPTNTEETYYISYSLNDSFYVDNEYIHTDGTNRSRVVFDETGDYSVSFETSEYDPATPVDLPLNPLYTIRTEGFVYVSFNEYTLDSVRVHLNPHKLLADGEDYLLLTIESLDGNGNPKPDQNFTLSTDFGSLENTNITTDHDGFATVILTSDDTFASSSGTIEISGDVAASVEFDIEEAKEPEPTLFAVTKSEQLPADGESKNEIYGRVRASDFTPISGANVTWKRARSIYDLFTDTDIQDDGSVTTATDGSFEIGPITTATNEEAGYWFVAIEATVGGVNVGDVVFWYEYPEASQGVENADGPQAAVQMSDSPGADPEYGAVPVQQFKYDEDGNVVTVSPDIVWSPPDWYAVSAHNKWMYGLDSNKTYTIT